MLFAVVAFAIAMVVDVALRLLQLSQQLCSQQNTIYQLAANIKVRCISYQLNACLVRGGGAQRSRIAVGYWMLDAGCWMLNVGCLQQLYITKYLCVRSYIHR